MIDFLYPLLILALVNLLGALILSMCWNSSVVYIWNMKKLTIAHALALIIILYIIGIILTPAYITESNMKMYKAIKCKLSK